MSNKPIYLHNRLELGEKHSSMIEQIQQLQKQMELFEAKLSDLQANEIYLRGIIDYVDGLEKIKKSSQAVNSEPIEEKEGE